MAIPTNLLPINTNVSRIEENVQLIPTPVIGKVPSNLIPVNATQISSSIQALAGEVPVTDIKLIQNFSTLNVVLPDTLFTSGSVDQIRDRTLRVAQAYVNGLPEAPEIPRIPTLVPRLPDFPPPRPSYGQIKNYIKTKVDRIKLQRQKASVKAVNEKLKQKENPFAHRQSIINTSNKNITNSVLGRYNNQ